jgi:hypothetical protein
MKPTTSITFTNLSKIAARFALLTSLCVSVCTSHANAQAAENLTGRIAITDMKQALKAALNGPVSGYFAGELATYATREFKSAALVLVDAASIGAHRQVGCGRLRVTLRQAAVQVPDKNGLLSKAAPQAMTFSINFCADGTYPVGESGSTQ